MKTEVKKIGRIEIKFTVSDDVRDLGNDPFFVKKAEESKRFLDKHGFPKEFIDRHKK